MRVRDLPIRPCPKKLDYDEMTPIDSARRRCDGCGEVVTDLSALEEEEAEAHLARGPSCARYIYDGDGNIVHRRRLLVAATAATLAAPLFVSCAGGVGGGFGGTQGEEAGTASVQTPEYMSRCTLDKECIVIHEGSPCCDQVCANASINEAYQDSYDSMVVSERNKCTSEQRSTCPQTPAKCDYTGVGCVDGGCKLMTSSSDAGADGG